MTSFIEKIQPWNLTEFYRWNHFGNGHLRVIYDEKTDTEGHLQFLIERLRHPSIPAISIFHRTHKCDICRNGCACHRNEQLVRTNITSFSAPSRLREHVPTLYAASSRHNNDTQWLNDPRLFEMYKPGEFGILLPVSLKEANEVDPMEERRIQQLGDLPLEELAKWRFGNNPNPFQANYFPVVIISQPEEKQEGGT